MIYYTVYDSVIGKLTLASDGINLIGLWIEGQKYFKSYIKEEMIYNNDLEIFKEVKRWLDNYFSGKKTSIENLKLKPDGSEFRKLVWKILCKIPYGKVRTYKDIAQEISNITGKKKMSSQAVGQAIGHNPISIIIPCHRVIGTNGNLTGYAGGLEIKKKLLEFENVDMTNLYIPKIKK